MYVKICIAVESVVPGQNAGTVQMQAMEECMYKTDPFMCKIDPPEGVEVILSTLGNNGFQAYAVGGCIRDSVMGRKPKDWDIATEAYPDDVRRLFEKTVDTGIAHGTVSVILDDVRYEVTTFRIDGRYEDGRHPVKVEFTPNIGDDLYRRDFTINAMAWNPAAGIIDPFGGIRDIACRIIRTVGDPAERFREDALRMLRAVRFASVLGFDIEKRTLDSIRENSSLITKISAERIREELTGILASGDPGKFMILKDTGLLRYIMPELDVCFDRDYGFSVMGEHCISSVKAAGADTYIRWAMLLHGLCMCPDIEAISAGENDQHVSVSESVGKNVEQAGIILSRLKFDNKSKNKILRLIRHLWTPTGTDRRTVARAVTAAGSDLFADLIKAKRAHITAELCTPNGLWSGLKLQTDKINKETVNEATMRSIEERGSIGGNPAACIHESAEKALRELDRTEEIYESLMESRYCLSLKDLAINGNDLKKLGFSEGSIIGRTLEYLLERVIDEPELNNKDALEKTALNFLKESEL